MAAERSAGFCEHCNKAVTVVKQKKTGILSKVQSTFASSGNGNWACTKCGNPATKGFGSNIKPAQTPPAPDVSTNDIDENGPSATQPESTINTKPPVPAMCPECNKPNPSDAEKCSFCNTPIPSSKPYEAICGICGKPIKFSSEMAGKEFNCQTCTEIVILPEAEGPVRTANRPLVLNLGTDPDRPEVNKAICTQCNYKLTYPKRLAGKNVECPSCSVKFNLP